MQMDKNTESSKYRRQLKFNFSLVLFQKKYIEPDNVNPYIGCLKKKKRTFPIYEPLANILFKEKLCQLGFGNFMA